MITTLIAAVGVQECTLVAGEALTDCWWCRCVVDFFDFPVAAGFGHREVDNTLINDLSTMANLLFQGREPLGQILPDDGNSHVIDCGLVSRDKNLDTFIPFFSCSYLPVAA